MTCAAHCTSGAVANGTFICVAGRIRLESVCPGRALVKMGDKVLFTLTAVASRCPPLKQLQSILAVALEVAQDTVDGVFCEAVKRVPLSKHDARLAGQDTAWALTIGGELNADIAEAKDLLPKAAQLSDSKTPEGSRFASAMSGALDFVGPIEQLRRPFHMPNQVLDVHASKTCLGGRARALGDDSNGTNCPATMAEGSTCAAKCSSGVTANGSFLCLAGTVRLESVCPGLGSVTLGDKALFTLGAVASQCPSPQQLRRILATALQVDTDTVNGVFCEAVPLSKDQADFAGHPTAQTLTIGGDVTVDADDAKALLQKLAQLPDSTTPVGNRFATAMSDALDYMGSVEQLHGPLHVPDQVTGFSKSCRGSDAQPLGGDSNGTNCSATMQQGETCSATCKSRADANESSAAANGTFVCLAGKVRLASVCGGESDGPVTLGSKVVFTLGGIASACPSPERLRAILASTLGVNESIVEGVFCEPGQEVLLSEADARLAGLPKGIEVTIGGEINPDGAEAEGVLEKVKQLPDRATDVGARFASALFSHVGFIGYLVHLHEPVLMSRQVRNFIVHQPAATTPVPPPIDSAVESTGLASGYLAALLVAAPLALGMLAVAACWCCVKYRDTGGKKAEIEWANV